MENIKEIRVRDLSIGMLYFTGGTITSENILKGCKNIALKIRKNSFPSRMDRNQKIGLWINQETTLSLLKLARKGNRAVMNTSWEDLLTAIQKGKEQEARSKKQYVADNKRHMYSHWQIELKELIEPLMKEGKSIRKPLQDYYKELVKRLYTIEALPTALMVLVRHRKYLKEASKISEDNSWKKSLVTKASSKSEWNSYQVDLEEARGIFLDPEDLKKRADKKQNEALEAKHEKRQPLPYTVPEFQKKLEKLFKSYDVRDNIIGAFLATGRRAAEVFEQGEFRLATEKEIKESHFPYLNHPSSFYIKGLAKKSEDDVEGVFPCLYDSNKVLRAIETLRIEKISKATILSWMREKHSEIGTALHETRRFYALYSYSIYNEDPRFSPVLWAKRALGHESDNWTSLHSYMVHVHKS